MKFWIIICGFMLFLGSNGQAQGISSSPSRIYFTLQNGLSGTQHLKVSNPGSRPLSLGISVGDWNYDSLGNNKMYESGTIKSSCAQWLKVLPGSYFTLQPGAEQNLTIEINVPVNADTSMKVHTAMIYLTQLNASDSKSKQGAALKVRVQMGIKVYHSFSEQSKPIMDIVNFKDTVLVKENNVLQKGLCLQLQNIGDLWVEGVVKWELLNEQNGKEQKLEETKIYSLPGDNRFILKALPNNLPKGKYSVSAIVNYGNKDDLKIAELEFLNN